MFEKMNANIATDVVRTLLHVTFRKRPQQPTPAVKTVGTGETPAPEPVKYDPAANANITPDDDGIDRSNPTAKVH